MNYVGIDPAANVGLVVVDEAGQFVARRTINVPTSIVLDVRLARTYSAVLEFLTHYSPIRVGIEVLRQWMAANASVKSFGIQAQFVGAVRAAVGSYRVPVMEQKPPCVKGRGRNARIEGLATGEMARAFLRGKWGKIADEMTEHEVDAAMIARKVAGV